MLDFQLLIGGEAGYGIMTAGWTFSKILTRLGLSVFDYVEYPSLIRGGHNAYYSRGSDTEIFSQKKLVDILVALNRQTIDLHKNEVMKGAFIIYDAQSFEVKLEDFPVEVNLCNIPLLQITKDLRADRIMINTVSVGASLSLISDTFDVLGAIIQEVFGRKGEEIIAINTNTAQAGFDYCKKNFASKSPYKVTAISQKSLLISGAEALALGAIRAGVKFAAMYPMTPINGIMNYLVAKGLEYAIVAKEPEDEISGLNMALGASFSGVRSMAATSGGGFSLMVEALGLAAQTETPIVIVEGMRPGPATGLPTFTEQGDLRFVLHAAQSEFPRIVVAPGDIFEAFSQTMQAFNLAEKYQLPVIVLVDKYLMEGHGSIDIEQFKVLSAKFKVERGKMVTDAQAATFTDYKRYLFTEDGISPRTIPGQKGGIALTGSDEHDERGLYNEEAENRVKMMDKRFKKLETAIVKKEFPPPVLHGSADAPLTILAFGSTKMTIFEAMQWLARENINVNFLQTQFLSPFPIDEVSNVLKKAKKTLVIENNKTGQFEGLIREHTGLSVTDHLRKYDGRPFYPEEIVEKIKTLL